MATLIERINDVIAQIGADIKTLMTSKVDSSEIGTSVQAYDANTAKTNVAQVYTSGQRGEITTLSPYTVIGFDLNDSNFFKVTLIGNHTLDNPTNMAPGQSGSFFISQDATGSRLLSYESYWEFPGGVAPTLSTGANKVDRLDYVVVSPTQVHGCLTKDWS